MPVSAPAPRWRPGSTVALRYFRRGELRWLKPVRVVDDSDASIALFLAADTVIKKPVQRSDGTEISRSLSYGQWFALDWELGEARWRDNSVLMLSRPGAAHSNWAFWDAADWTFRAWYVNLQQPLTRTPIGFDTEDHVLDLVIEPDVASWSWKDEDELADAIRVGRFTPSEAAAIRSEGKTAIAALEAREWPFDQGWEEWRPDPTWSLPRLERSWESWPRGAAPD